MVAMPVRVPGGGSAESQARRIRARRSSGVRARRDLRRRRGEDRRVRALLLVRGRDWHVSRRGGHRSGDRRERGGRARPRAPARDRLCRGTARRGRGGAPRRAPLRGAGLRRLPAPVRAKLSTDGGARGNPGPAAYGYVLETGDGTVLAAHGEAIGVATNNVAEYSALIAGLEKALELQVDEVEVVSDSELMVKQMRGEYRVKNAALQELQRRAAALAARLRSVTYTAVRREHNELADRLVNDALDAQS